MAEEFEKKQMQISQQNSQSSNNEASSQGQRRQTAPQKPNQNFQSPPKKTSNNFPQPQQKVQTAKADIGLADERPKANQQNSENNIFNKHYNKELKLCEDEIPMVLCELNESALAYLARDQFENALLLLQKAHGVLDVVDLSGSKRDELIALQLFHNMAMCYQKQGQLEECALCLETTLDQMGESYALDKGQSFSMRIYKIKIEVRLRLQFCAILSQLHRHKEALEQAEEAIKLSHLLVRDKIAVCRYYSKRLDFIDQYGSYSDHNNSFYVETDIDDKTSKQKKDKDSSDPYASTTMDGKQNRSTTRNQGNTDKFNGFINDLTSSTHNQEENEHQAGNNFDRQVANNKNLDDLSVDSLNNYQTENAILNNLEGSISIAERTAKKLLPIYLSLLSKVTIIEKTRKNQQDSQDLKHDESIVDDIAQSYRNGKNKQDQQKSNKKVDSNIQMDLRHILGFLNQTEWVQNLNIGNIMQISPIKLLDLTQIRRNEECLSRDSFLDVISFLIVGYFCASTEIRFIIQLKEEIPKFKNFLVDKKTKESELWHSMSLDIACSFLPSDCPLLNHILISYQKHHAPSQSKIPENQELDEKLRVIKPGNGIDNSKFQPIIRVLQEVKINLAVSKIPSSQKTVNKLLRDAQTKHIIAQERSQAFIKQMQGGNSKSPMAQQAQRKSMTNIQNGQNLSKHQAIKLLKLLKLEKIVQKFAKDVGYDKKQVLRFLIGKGISSQVDTSQQSRIIESNTAQRSLVQSRPMSVHNAMNTHNNSQFQPSGYVSKQNEFNGEYQSELIDKNKKLQEPWGNLMVPSQSFQENDNLLSKLNVNQLQKDDLRSKSAEANQDRKIQQINKKQNQIQEKENEKKAKQNEIIDRGSRFLFNQSDFEVQHHNMSTNIPLAESASNSGPTSQGGTVRMGAKRVQTQERGKVQRPRSSKGYRGNNQLTMNQRPETDILTGQSNNPAHQISASNLPTSAQLVPLLQGIKPQLNISQQQFQTTTAKSEERQLRSQQNQRQIIQKGTRTNIIQTTSSKDKTLASQTQSGFHKDQNGQKKLYALNAQLQQQNQQQLSQAQISTNFQKLVKKNNLKVNSSFQTQNPQSMQVIQGNYINNNQQIKNLNMLRKKDSNTSPVQLQTYHSQSVAQLQSGALAAQLLAYSQPGMVNQNIISNSSNNIRGHTPDMADLTKVRGQKSKGRSNNQYTKFFQRANDDQKINNKFNA